MTTPYNFSAQFTDEGGATCLQPLVLNVAEACVPDTGVPPPNPLVDPQPTQVRIKDFDITLFGSCSGCTPNTFGFLPFDGTFPVGDALGTNLEQWLPPGSIPGVFFVPGFDINGVATRINTLRTVAVYLVGSAIWTLRIQCFNHNDIWLGTKTVGGDPTGTYMRSVSVQYAAGPDCLKIESY